MSDSPETVRDLEQTYFDAAKEHRERARHDLGEAAEAAVDPKTAAWVRAGAMRSAGRLGGPDEAVAEWRADTVDGDVFYVGKHAIFDNEHEAIVINWQAPVAVPLYEATHDEPNGVLFRRTFECAGNRIETFYDLVFADLEQRIANLTIAEPTVDDALLAALGRQRSGEMQDIVATITAAQYRLFREDMDQLLVIQGGPGTGKTIVALHRVSWLLFNHSDILSPEDVLVVGPNRTFVRYIGSVLPSLGDAAVVQRDMTQLAPQVSGGREEPDEVARIKGDMRMEQLLDRALDDRIGVPDSPLQATIGGRQATLDRNVLAKQLDSLRTRPYGMGRQLMRDWLRGQVDDIEATRLDGLLDRLWPQLSAPAFLQELLGSESRLLRAAGDAFTAAEVTKLYRRAAERISSESWTAADLPLLDYVDFRMTGISDRFRHVVVDEAQDLSPMQLSSLARRSANGSMTILGDIAQSTGVWARDSWADVIEALRQDLPDKVVDLIYGYRVPRQVFEFAAQLLPSAAPTVAPPVVVRDGPDPVLCKVDADEVIDRAVTEATEYLGRGLMVAVVCPEHARDEMRAALDAKDIQWRDPNAQGLGAGVNLISPLQAKGLEFDAVIVMHPELIAEGAARGARLLYVALTRTTRHLSVVYSRSALPQGSVPTPAAQPAPDGGQPGYQDTAQRLEAVGRGSRAVTALAEALADEIRTTVQPTMWADLLAALAERLSDDRPGDNLERLASRPPPPETGKLT